MTSSSSSSSSFFLGAILVVALILLLTSSVASSHVLTSYDHHHHHPWKTFRNFTGCRLGDHRPGLAHLKKYLHRFGYLPRSPPANFSDDFDHELHSALVAYQRHFRLDSTGVLDATTLSLISTPRCGVPDAVNGTASSRAPRGRNLYSYFPGNPSWPPSKRNLTYAFRSTEGVSAAVRELFARAFARWSGVTSFTFSETDSGSDAHHHRLLQTAAPRHLQMPLEFAIDAIDTLQRRREHLPAPPVLHQQRRGDGRGDRCTLQQHFQLSKLADEEAALGGGALDVPRCDYANSRLAETAILTQ